MKPADAARELSRIIAASQQLGGPVPSAELQQFLLDLAAAPALRAVKKSKTSKPSQTRGGALRVGSRVKRASEATMSKTIEQLAQKLRNAFQSDEQFEQVLAGLEMQTLPKASVVVLYNRIFTEPRPIAKSMTKTEIFNAIRRERIARARGGIL